MFSIPCENNSSEKGYTRTKIRHFYQRVLMDMIDTSKIIKQEHINQIH